MQQLQPLAIQYQILELENDFTKFNTVKKIPNSIEIRRFSFFHMFFLELYS